MKPEKHIILLSAGMLVLSCFFLLPRNQEWMSNRIVPYWYDFQIQKNKTSFEERRIQRFKSAYVLSKQIADFFKSKQIDRDVLVLVPPASYFKQHNLNYPVPEPAVFYYFTGLKTIRPKSREAIRANWYVRAEKGKLIFDSVTNRNVLADSIRAFNQFPDPL